MWDILFYLLLVIVIGAIAIIAALVVRGYLTGTSPTAVLFGPRPERRLDVVDHANIDGRRRLVLIRRDDVEHLILTGGPVDVVIETGISARRPVKGNGELPEEPSFTRSTPAARTPSPTISSEKT